MSVDTIAAIATPPGRGGVCIIRVSGPEVKEIAGSIVGRCPKPRYATFARFLDPEDSTGSTIIDEGIAIYFPGPNSFTGEDVLELQGHGGVVISDMILNATVAAGARLARPGEFSERAFLNEKLDLTQAEAIVDLIDAGSRQAAKAALRSLEGEFSKRIYDLLEELISLRMYVESSMDFVDEEIELLKSGDIQSRLQKLTLAVKKILQVAGRGRVLGEGIQMVIAGKPNAGKSSLMNALSGRETAIVTDIPGTTRDIIRENIVIEGIPVHIHDTAGIREDAGHIEEEGIRRAKESISNADIILWVHDDTTSLDENDYAGYPVNSLLLVKNKIDISGNKAGKGIDKDIISVAISTKESSGLDVLRSEILQLLKLGHFQENDFSARQRHLQALHNTLEFLQYAQTRLDVQLVSGDGGELLAEELRMAQQHLNEITGEFTSDDLLGKIFSEFCIGK